MNARKCSKCGAEHERKHSWCGECSRRDQRERMRSVAQSGRSRFELSTDWAPSRPPPPPPGFDARDLTAGKPLG